MKNKKQAVSVNKSFAEGIDTPSDWLKNPAVRQEVQNTITLYHEYRKMVVCEKCLRLDSQFDAIA